MTSDFNYKKYSLENLENWMHDAMSCAEASPQEIYDVIKSVVEDNYYTYKNQASQAYELLALLNGNGKGHLSCDKDDESEECKKSWNDFWEENYYPEKYKGSTVSSVSDVMPPWGHSDMEALKYTDEELNAMCEKAASDYEKEQCREYSLPEYYNNDLSDGWEMTADGFWIPPQKEDKVTKWVLPVELDGPSGEYFISLPDDLQDASGIHEGDQIQWVDNKDGSYTICKITKPLDTDEC